MKIIRYFKETPISIGENRKIYILMIECNDKIYMKILHKDIKVPYILRYYDGSITVSLKNSFLFIFFCGISEPLKFLYMRMRG